MKGLSIGGWKGADLLVSGNYSGKKIGIQRARLVWGGQEMEIRGVIGGTSPDARLNLEGSIAGRSLAEVFRNLRIVPPVDLGFRRAPDLRKLGASDRGGGSTCPGGHTLRGSDSCARNSMHAGRTANWR